jgi:hypothetical protein
VKWLPCEHCKEGAYGGASRRFPDGEPLVVGTIHHFPHRYRCSRCQRLNSVTPGTWRLLPEMSEKEAIELGVLPTVVPF